MTEKNPAVSTGTDATDAANLAALDKLRQAKSATAMAQPAAPPPKAPATAPAATMTEEQVARLKQAYRVVEELQGLAWPGERPADLPEVRPLRKYRLRLKSVTSNVNALGENPLRDYMRRTKSWQHPLVSIRPEMAVHNFECPDGLDVIEAHHEAEAWAKFCKRFNIVRTSEPYSIHELNSEGDVKAEQQEEAELRQEITLALARRGLVPTTPPVPTPAL